MPKIIKKLRWRKIDDTEYLFICLSLSVIVIVIIAIIYSSLLFLLFLAILLIIAKLKIPYIEKYEVKKIK